MTMNYPPLASRGRARIRRLMFGELAVLADRLNELFYNLAIRFNKIAGWLLRHRDDVPDNPSTR